MQMTKLLVARIKNTKLIQSFYLTINLTESSMSDWELKVIHSIPKVLIHLIA